MDLRKVHLQQSWKIEKKTVLFQVVWTYSCRKTLTFFLRLCLLNFSTLTFYLEFEAFESLSYCLRSGKKKMLLLEWTITKSTLKGNFPFKIISFSVKIWWSGCTENLHAVFMPVIQTSVTQGLVWYHIALWPWLSFTEKVIITVWGVQAKALHNRKRQNHDKCHCWEGI